MSCKILERDTEMTEFNKTQRPFFKLPSELRNLVYEFLPTGYVVCIRWTSHIHTINPTALAMSCFNPDFHREVIKGKGEVFKQGIIIGNSLPASTIFAFRLVCRQMTFETERVVSHAYTDNTFLFSTTIAAACFARRLSTTQRFSITSICVFVFDASYIYWYRDSAGRQAEPFKCFRDEFPMLKRIFLPPEARMQLDQARLWLDSAAPSALFGLGPSPQIPLELYIVNLRDAVQSSHGDPDRVIQS
ncbi:hypothetical protein K491DRAFT_775228 [Lophiostoma macrostomum CBS 122681]|uniref:DUF7730 domain-containing protein n=1 Tax=Lophiostoma macrostomum CBS 122681 TaxID=1314788 RepID=A0A6A6TJX8_9PLEO|nr:hypothetical protein K491DRAFT_775228 [Lophiostoma macrostomum CBS 122681]